MACGVSYQNVFFAFSWPHARQHDSTNVSSVTYQFLYSCLLFSSSMCSLILLPFVIHEFDDWSKVFKFSIAAFTCTMGSVLTIVSRLIALYNMKYKYQKYKTTLDSFEIYVPTDTVSTNRAMCLSYMVIFLYIIILLPFNGLRIWYILANHNRPMLMTAFFALYYLQNFCLGCTEIDFAMQCFVVHSKFRDINDELKRVNTEYNKKYNKRYARLEYESGTSAGHDDAAACLIVYEKDFYSPKDKGCPLANIVELLRIKHWLTREAVNDLKSIFGFQLGVSIFYIIMSMLFDVYTEVFYSYSNIKYNKPVIRSKTLLVGWILQYSYRFSLIVITAHTTTKQAVKTKRIISEMNNRHFDIDAKEELQVFHNQLSICSIAFSVGDFFTLSNNLFTSVMAIGATVILLLVQFHSEKHVDKS